MLREIGSTEGGRAVVWSTTLRDQSDPSRFYTLVIFKGEEEARKREASPDREELIRRMGELFEGQREFVNLEVFDETIG